MHISHYAFSIDISNSFRIEIEKRNHHNNCLIWYVWYVHDYCKPRRRRKQPEFQNIRNHSRHNSWFIYGWNIACIFVLTNNRTTWRFVRDWVGVFLCEYICCCWLLFIFRLAELLHRYIVCTYELVVVVMLLNINRVFKVVLLSRLLAEKKIGNILMHAYYVSVSLFRWHW